MEIKEQGTDRIIRMEKIYAERKKDKTLLSIWEGDEMVVQALLTARQLERMREFIGHRLTELL